MRFPSKEIVEQVRRQYPVGTRVELLRMDDVQAPPIGARVRSKAWMIRHRFLWLGTTVPI